MIANNNNIERYLVFSTNLTIKHTMNSPCCDYYTF